MKPFSFDWPLSAGALVHQAKVCSDLARLIMDGITEVESWLIANRILPALIDKELQNICFTLSSRGHDKRIAALVPLPDGSAFICNVLGLWLPLDKQEADHEIHYIGSRYAPGNHWGDGFQASLRLPDGSLRTVTPAELAGIWQAATGSKPKGFDTGLLDHLEAIGYDVVDKVFTTQGRLGL